MTTAAPSGAPSAEPVGTRGPAASILDWLERVGNRCPDPVVLFLLALMLTWVASSLLAGRDFGLTDPRTAQSLRINDQLTLRGFAAFLAGMTHAFVTFAPLGLVLVMGIGVGVAERAGLVGGALRFVLAVAPARTLTFVVVVASIAARMLADSATIIVVPLGAALFYVAGRHPLAGIVAAFAPLFGAMFGNFLPYALDPVLAGFSEAAARIINPVYRVNPLSNYWLSLATAIAVVPVSCWLVDRVVEPRLAGTVVDGDKDLMPSAPTLTRREYAALATALAAMLLMSGAMAWAAMPGDSPFRAPDGTLTGPGSPLMQGLIPLLLILTLGPSLAYGIVAGTLRTPGAVVAAMAATMSSLAYYIVMVFFAALFTRAFSDSNIGALIALEGADVLRALGMPAPVTIVGIVLLTAALDVLVPSASAKWALLAPILVPMLMSVGIAPELTQAAFRLGDGPVNLLTPLMPHFPLVLAFCRRYVTGFGVGTLMSLVLPFGLTYLVLQVVMLLVWWALGLPLGIAGRYAYP